MVLWGGLHVSGPSGTLCLTDRTGFVQYCFLFITSKSSALHAHGFIGYSNANIYLDSVSGHDYIVPYFPSDDSAILKDFILQFKWAQASISTCVIAMKKLLLSANVCLTHFPSSDGAKQNYMNSITPAMSNEAMTNWIMTLQRFAGVCVIHLRGYAELAIQY